MSLENLSCNTVPRQPRQKKGFIETLNCTGYMLSKPHPYSQLFIDAVPFLEDWVLDIGAAYGVTTIPCLKKGGCIVANDIEPRHLYILSQKTPRRLMNQLYLLPGKFPDDIEFPENSFAAIHAAGVLHFLTPDLFEAALQKIFNLLKPGGKFYFITTTPFVRLFSEFLPTFRQRKEQCHPWPGLIEDSSPFNKGNRYAIPKLLNLFDIETTQKVLIKFKFAIERIDYIPYPKAPIHIRGDGRDTIGVIAVKPYRSDVPMSLRDTARARV